MRTRKVGPLRVTWIHRPGGSYQGRFGGGWNWNVGVQAGGRTVIINLLVASVRIIWPRILHGDFVKRDGTRSSTYEQS